MHILIVDDHREFAQTLATLLVESSTVPLTVDIGFDGVQAVQLALCHPPAVAFLDIEMPRTNGADAAMAIRDALSGRAPLMVAVTGNPDLLTAAALTGLFNWTLCKPIQPEDLLAVIGAAAATLQPPTVQQVVGGSSTAPV